MSIMNKLDTVSSKPVAKITHLQNTGNVQGSSARQDIADGGKPVPVAGPDFVPPDAKTTELNSAVSNVIGYVQNISRELNFSIDQELGETVVTVVDVSTGDVIRQIPSEEMLALSRHLAETREKTAKGLLFSSDA